MLSKIQNIIWLYWKKFKWIYWKKCPLSGYYTFADIGNAVYGSATLPNHCQLSCCSIYKGIDLSIVCYANELFDVSRTTRVGILFPEISENYCEIEFFQNATKCDILILNEVDVRRGYGVTIDLNGAKV